MDDIDNKTLISLLSKAVASQDPTVKDLLQSLLVTVMITEPNAGHNIFAEITEQINDLRFQVQSLKRDQPKFNDYSNSAMAKRHAEYTKRMTNFGADNE